MQAVKEKERAYNVAQASNILATVALLRKGYKLRLKTYHDIQSFEQARAASTSMLQSSRSRSSSPCRLRNAWTHDRPLPLVAEGHAAPQSLLSACLRSSAPARARW